MPSPWSKHTASCYFLNPLSLIQSIKVLFKRVMILRLLLLYLNNTTLLGLLFNLNNVIQANFCSENIVSFIAIESSKHIQPTVVPKHNALVKCPCRRFEIIKCNPSSPSLSFKSKLVHIIESLLDLVYPSKYK